MACGACLAYDAACTPRTNKHSYCMTNCKHGKLQFHTADPTPTHVLWSQCMCTGGRDISKYRRQALFLFRQMSRHDTTCWLIYLRQTSRGMSRHLHLGQLTVGFGSGYARGASDALARDWRGGRGASSAAARCGGDGLVQGLHHQSALPAGGGELREARSKPTKRQRLAA